MAAAIQSMIEERTPEKFTKAGPFGKIESKGEIKFHEFTLNGIKLRFPFQPYDA
jgi:hypothetical protein